MATYYYEKGDQKGRVGTTHLNTIPACARTVYEPFNDMWARIFRKAYEVWEQRRMREGHALQDWLDAETMVTEDIHEARQ